MARRSLRPHLNQIRGWVRQGRTDAWIAHQLEVTVQEIQQFKRQNELVTGDEAPSGSDGEAGEVDLRAEDDALIAAELEAAEAKRATARAKAATARAKADAEDEADENGDAPDESARPTRRRGRRGGRSRRGTRAGGPLEGTFDHGEEGYGLWLDPAVQDDGVYAEHWAGHRPVEVTIEEDQIVIRRAGADDDQ